MAYPVLAPVSRSYPGLAGRLPTCYSPVRRWILIPKDNSPARLACIRHAASVHPEPGSNSPKKFDVNSQELTSHVFTLQFSRNTSFRFMFAALSRRQIRCYHLPRHKSTLFLKIKSKKMAGTSKSPRPSGQLNPFHIFSH